MAIPGLHLTKIGNGDYLLEPANSLNLNDQARLIESVAARLIKEHASRLYYDLSTLSLIDPLYYSWLNALARAAQTINVKMICINMQPTAAFALSKFMSEKPFFATAHSI
jgi:rsbT antagonist protein RsbS